MALNPSVGSNNILGLAAAVSALGRGDAGYCDTGEPTSVASSAPNAGGVAKTATFLVNSAGTQPQVTRGGWALCAKAQSATAGIGTVTIWASDGTNNEVVGSFTGGGPAGYGVCYAEPFNTSIAAGVDKGAITNVVSLTASVVLTGTGNVTLMFAAVGAT